MDVPKHALNALIMNYLIVEGYQDAAEKFAHEAKIDLAMPCYGLSATALDDSSTTGAALTSSSLADRNREHLKSVQTRLQIKHLILRGQVQAAIELINDVDPSLLDTHAALHFSLLRLQLIELIRCCHRDTQSSSEPSALTLADITPALEFAASHLARRAPANPQFLDDLERTMALLCFPPDKMVPQLRELMDVRLRARVSHDVNTTLLAAQGIEGESRIEGLIKLWGWAEHELEMHDGPVVPTLDKASLL